MGMTLEFKRRETKTTSYIEIGTDIVLTAVQYFAFMRGGPVTATRLLVKAQQTGMTGKFTPFGDKDEELIEKLKEFAQPDVYEVARVQLFIGLGVKE